MAKEDEDITKLEEQVTELTEALEKAVEASAEAGKEEVAELTEKVDDLTKALEKAKTDNDELTLKANMSDEEKNHCKNMTPADKMTFFGKSPADRKASMSKQAEDDEVIKVEGQEIKKSVVGDAQFNIIKAQDQRLKKADEDIAKERDARELSDLRKRADDEFPHVPGDVDERAAMLKAIVKMDEPLRKTFEAVFTQSEKLAKASFETVGHKGGSEDTLDKRKKSGISAFEKKVDEIHKSTKGLSRSDAMSKARQQYPAEYAEYNATDTGAN